MSKSKSEPTQVSKSSVPQLGLSDFGLSAKNIVDRSRIQKRVNAEIMNTDRPSNVWYRMNGQTMYWYQYYLMDWYMSEVSVLSTIVLRSTTELLRYGLEMTPKFAKKCTQCGYESQTVIEKCPCCRSFRLRDPDSKQKEFFKRPNGKSFIDEANNNGQSLKDVLKSYAASEYQNNQAYTLCVTGDVVDKDTGELIRGYPLEFINFDPKFVRYLYDDTGRPGTRYAFTMDKRDVLIDLDEDPDASNSVSDEGKVLYPAHWRIGANFGGTGEYKLYTSEEVYQDHWFKQTLLYGQPIWYDIEDDLLTYHYIEKHNLKKYKFGYVRKVLILPGFNDEDVEDITKGIQDILATNDNSIPIICTPPQLNGTAEMKAQTLELGTESSQDLMLIKNDIRDRLCAHGGVPNLFAGDVESSGGMNNESQQITAFDRYLMDKYDYLDRQLRWVMSWFPRITDWELTVTRPSKAAAGQRRRLDQIQEAQGMKGLGFQVTFVNGEFRYSEKTVDQMQQEMQAQQAAMGGGQVGPELQEKGSARREDGEIGDSKEAVDDSAHEATDAFAASVGERTYAYRKKMTPQGWNYLLAREAYSYLDGNVDKATEELVKTLGKQMSTVFKTCDEEQARAIYAAIIDEVMKDEWTHDSIKARVLEICGGNPGFSESDADRIVRTEIGRVLNHAREMHMRRDGKAGRRCVWNGPLDKKTTPMCMYAQTGKLPDRYKDMKGSLPAFHPEGLPIEELKMFLHGVWQAFHDAGLLKTEWVSDWSLHIGCRHTFQPKSPRFTKSPGAVRNARVGDSDLSDDTKHVHGIKGLLFALSDGWYAPEDAPEDAEVFTFDMDSMDMLTWSKTCALMLSNGEDRRVVHDMLADETEMDSEEIEFMLDNAVRVYRAMLGDGE